MAGADVLLPTLYYAASDFAMKDILEEAGFIGMECLGILLSGRERLDSSINSLVAKLPRELLKKAKSGTCPNCTTSRSDSIDGLQKFVNTLDLQDLVSHQIVAQCFPWLYQNCAQDFKAVINNARQEIWAKVPSFFGCPGWDVLQARLQEIS